MPLKVVIPEHVQRRIGPEAGGPPGEGGVLLDAVLEEGVEHESDVTAYPVELGADINDHVILRPMNYTLTGGVTDTPTTYAGTTYNHPDSTLRSKAAWALLVDLMVTREPFEIDTGFLRYPDMVIKGLTSKKDATREGAIIFEARLRQLNLVSTRVTAAEVKQRSPGQAEDGADEVEENGPTKGKTLPAAAVDALSDTIGGYFQ